MQINRPASSGQVSGSSYELTLVRAPVAQIQTGKDSSDASRVFQTTPHKASRVHETHEAQVAAVLHGRKTKDC